MTHRDAGILLSELRHITTDLQGLVGQPVRGAWVPEPGLVLLEIGSTLLRIEAWPLPRLHTVRARPRSPTHPLSFQGLLRARLMGPLRALRTVGADRAVDLEFDQGTLHARLFGRGGGIWWVEDGAPVAASDGPAEEALAPTGHADPDRSPRFAPVDGSWDLGARAWFEEVAAVQRREAWRSLVRSALRREVDRQRRMRTNLEADLEHAGRAGDLRRAADALAAVLHRVPRGADRVVAPDLEGGPDREITLDPARPPSATLQRMYDKAGRLERSQEVILGRLLEAEARLGEATRLLGGVDALDEPGLRALAKTLRLPDPTRRPPPAPPHASGHWRWVDGTGHLIRVGRNDAGNHALVFRLSRGRDLWLHLRERPGAHVVVSADRKEGPSPALVDAGVQLLLLTARIPIGDTVEVQTARVADLRAIPGEALGRVQVLRERVLLATRREAPPPGWSRE